jgi:hypothetical protein
MQRRPGVRGWTPDEVEIILSAERWHRLILHGPPDLSAHHADHRRPEAHLRGDPRPQEDGPQAGRRRHRAARDPRRLISARSSPWSSAWSCRATSQIDRKKQRYTITKAGYAYIASLIDEAEAMIDEFDDWETLDMVAELIDRNLDPLRARFLWGWYQGEFDDLVQFQQRRGIDPVEYEWPAFLVSDAFYDNLALDLESDPEDPN